MYSKIFAYRKYIMLYFISGYLYYLYGINTISLPVQLKCCCLTICYPFYCIILLLLSIFFNVSYILLFYLQQKFRATLVKILE